MQKEIDSLAAQLQTQPKISDEKLEQLFEVCYIRKIDSLFSTNLSTPTNCLH